MEKSVIEIKKIHKKEIIRWQSWLQAKAGKYISQGTAVWIACILSRVLLDELPKDLRKAGLNTFADMIEIISEKIVEVAGKVADGELEEFDPESILAKISTQIRNNKT